MNQENNFNIQNNNGISNNQGNMNQNLGNTSNQSVQYNTYQTISNQQQSTSNYQHSTAQEFGLQSTNTLEDKNNYNKNLNPKPSKRNKIGLIIGITIIVIVIAIIVVTIIFKDGKLEGFLDNNLTKNSNISQISITNAEIVALTNNGDLYQIGDVESILGSNPEDYNDLEKVASGVERFYSNNTAIYYIDNQHDLYYLGASYNGGSSDEVKKDYSGVRDIIVYQNFCGIVIKDNDDVHVKSNKYIDNFCGFKKKYGDFTKVASDAKKVFAGYFYSGYISNDDELYLLESSLISNDSNTEYKKILDNVNSVSTYLYSELLILTNDNKLYIYYNKDGSGTIKLLQEDVVELGYDYFKTSNGEYNMFSYKSYFGFAKGESKILYESSNDIYYTTLDVQDIKEILYYNCSRSYDFSLNKYNENNKLIYLSNDGMVVLLDKNGEKRVSYNTDNLKEIFEFVIAEDDEN